MAKRKDPAFLFYPNRWLQGTAKMMPEEKGIYIDLLSHQHQDGYIPNNTRRLARMVGMSEADFLKLWEVVCFKFIPDRNGNLVNQTLTNLVNERSTNAEAKKINGTFASAIRLLDATQEIKEQIKKSFDYTEFLDFGNQNLTKLVADWVQLCLKSIININVNKGKDKIEGVGERKGWSQFPQITSLNGLPDGTVSSVKEIIRIIKRKDIKTEDITGLWEAFKPQYLTGQKFYATADDVYSHFTNWIKKQDFEDGKPFNGKNKLGNKSGGFSILTEALDQDK